jgi:hypothetical protein
LSVITVRHQGLSLVFSEKKFNGIVEEKTETLVLPAYRRLILLMMIRIKSIKRFFVLLPMDKLMKRDRYNCQDEVLKNNPLLFQICRKREDSAKSFGYRFSQNILKLRPLPRLIPALSKTSFFLEEIFYE